MKEAFEQHLALATYTITTDKTNLAVGTIFRKLGQCSEVDVFRLIVMMIFREPRSRTSYTSEIAT